MAKVIVYLLRSYDMVGKIEVEIEADLPQMSLGEASVLFKRVYRRANIKGKAFIMRVDEQVFYVARDKKFGFTVYNLGE